MLSFRVNCRGGGFRQGCERNNRSVEVLILLVYDVLNPIKEIPPTTFVGNSLVRPKYVVSTRPSRINVGLTSNMCKSSRKSPKTGVAESDVTS